MYISDAAYPLNKIIKVRTLLGAAPKLIHDAAVPDTFELGVASLQ